MTTATSRLRAFRTLVNGWTAGRLTEADIDNFVRATWLTAAEGERIKALPRGDRLAANKLIDEFRAEVEQVEQK